MIRRGLEQVLQGGIRPAWLVRCHDLMELDYVSQTAGARADDPYVRAIAVEGLVRDAHESLGSGPVGIAARLLLGALPETRGRLLKDRRRIAAAELDVLPSTFRKNYEDAILMDVAVTMWSLTQDMPDAKADTEPPDCRPS